MIDLFTAQKYFSEALNARRMAISYLPLCEF